MSTEIDPVQLGRLMAQIEHLSEALEEHRRASERQAGELKAMIQEQAQVIRSQQESISALQQIANRGYGALYVLLSIGAAAGVVVSWIISMWKSV